MISGLLLCVGLAVLAYLLGGLQHVIGAPMIGLILGILAANILPAAVLERCGKGIGFSAKRILRAGIIIAGGTLNFKAIVNAGMSALPLMIGAILISFCAAWLFGKAMRVTPNARLLVGGGTSICGGTAIATISAVIEADEEDTAYAMTAIFLFDLLAALIWPYLAFYLGFTPDQYGILGGVAINDVSSVTAAGDTFNTLTANAVNAQGMTGGDLAMIIKLTRVSMLVVVALVLTLIHQAQKKRSAAADGSTGTLGANLLKAFPFYVLGFLALAIANTIVDFKTIMIGTSSLGVWMGPVYKFMFAVALAAVGSKIKLKSLLTKGVRPILLGGLTWAAVSVVTIAYALIFS